MLGQESIDSNTLRFEICLEIRRDLQELYQNIFLLKSGCKLFSKPYICPELTIASQSAYR